MIKRDVLKPVGGAALAVGAAPIGAFAAAAQSPSGTRRLKNFVWLRPSVTKSADDRKRDFDLWRASGIHAITPEIYNGRETLFQSHRLPVKSPWLEKTIPIAKAAGLEVHAWMWSMPCLIDNIIKTHPD